MLPRLHRQGHGQIPFFAQQIFVKTLERDNQSEDEHRHEQKAEQGGDRHPENSQKEGIGEILVKDKEAGKKSSDQQGSIDGQKDAPCGILAPQFGHSAAP